MRAAALKTVLAIAVLGTGLAQAGTVEVSFDRPERFADIGPASDTTEVLQIIDRHLQALGQAGLPSGQTLKVNITDIDLAGEIRPGAGRFADIRVLGRGADWPRISLQYTLSEGDRVLAQGSDNLADLAYLMRLAPYRPNVRLPYEQRLLSEWFAERFGPARR